MTRFALIASILVTGCVSSDTLAEDAWYIGVPTRYVSAADCLAHSTHPFQWDCSFALTLCHSGEAALRTGDVVVPGTYAMDGGIARGTFDINGLTSSGFALDVTTLTEPGKPIVDGVRWTHDTEGRSATLVYDTIDCR